MAFFKSSWMLFIACVFTGALSAFAMAPHNLWPLLFIGLSTLYICLSYTRNALQAFGFGWGFGFGYFVFGLSWIGNALLVDGNNYAWAWPLAVIALPAVLSFYPALACLLTRLSGSPQKISSFLVFVILFFGSEILRGHLFTGFPWNLYGYTWSDIKPILQSVVLFNVYGLTAFTIFWGAFPGFTFVRARENQLNIGWVTLGLLVMASFGILFVWGNFRLENTLVQNHKDISIKIVQPNIEQSEKWNRNKMQSHFERLLNLSKAAGNERDTTFIIWPETAMNPYIMSAPENKQALKDILQGYAKDAYLLTGALRHDPSDNRYSNSLLFFNNQGENTQIYDKSHLVPFGEYIPFKDFIPLETITRFSGFEPGKGNVLLTTPAGISYSPLICYEVIFPGKVINPNLPKPDFIVNVTNDAWYGDSAGPYQHLTTAKFRAVEEGITVIRVANTGISAIIDPLGNIRYQSILFEEQENSNLLPEKIEQKLNINFLNFF